MSRLIDYLDELNINSIESLASYVTASTIDVLLGLVNYARMLVQEDWIEPEYSPFSFVPSQELSGFGGCAGLECRNKRASEFAKFSALYADSGYIYIPILSIPHRKEFENNEVVDRLKKSIFSDFSSVIIYSALITKGIVRIVPSNLNICENCFIELYSNKDDDQHMRDIVDEYSEKIILTATSYNPFAHRAVLEVSNLPELFTDHNRLIVYTSGIMYDEIRKCKQFPEIIGNKKMKREIAVNIIVKEYRNVKFDAYLSALYKAKYITQNESTSHMFETTKKKNFQQVQPILPIYDMPVIDNVDIATILDIRFHEEDAFDTYRVALNKAIHEHRSGQSELEIREVYDDIVYPEFVKLDNSITNLKRKHLLRATGELVILGTTVTLGIISGIVPLTALGVGGAISLAPTIRKIAENKMEDTEVKNNDYYFLWKLRNSK